MFPMILYVINKIYVDIIQNRRFEYIKAAGKNNISRASSCSFPCKYFTLLFYCIATIHIMISMQCKIIFKIYH